MKMLLGYITCFYSVRLVFLTLLTSLYLRSRDAMVKVDDLLRSNQVIIYGVAAIVFILILQILHPLTQTRFRDVFDFSKLRGHFTFPALLALGTVLVFIVATGLGGFLHYLGVYIKFDEVVISVASIAVFSISLFAMISVEEYILRRVLETSISKKSSTGVGLLCSSLAFFVIKRAQFDIKAIEALNFVLLNLVFSRLSKKGTVVSSIIFATTFFTLLHVGFGLPFINQDMPGIFLLRGAAADDEIGCLLSGGPRGPEAGIALSVILVIYLLNPTRYIRK